MHETIVYVVPVPARDGEPTGFHKCGGQFYLEQAPANLRSWRAVSATEKPWPVVECVIMTRERYEELCRACDSRSAGAAEGL